jgi:hypothetical protein
MSSDGAQWVLIFPPNLGKTAQGLAGCKPSGSRALKNIRFRSGLQKGQGRAAVISIRQILFGHILITHLRVR